MMVTWIVMTEQAPAASFTGPVLRADWAWALMMPDAEPGRLPDAGALDQLLTFARWFWETMGRVAGPLKSDPPAVVLVAAPPLDRAAREYLTRLCSFWAPCVHWLADGQDPAGDGEGWENRWLAPVADIMSVPPDNSAWARSTAVLPDGEDRFLLPIMGVGRAFMKVQLIRPGWPSARLHSHAAVDEYYLVLTGHGTLRMGDHTVPIGPGHLIGKPTGPNLASSLVADQEEALTVLDIEVWPDASRTDGTNDACAYPDHRELYLSGPGWGAMVPMDALGSPRDAGAHYQEGYVRHLDGSWESRAFLGHAARAGAATPT
jgi:uncharacterized cupin superfamily protein